jgi:hypothetical protein
VSGYSRAAPIPSLLIRWGFRLFGRWTQRRFYLAIQRRMRSLVQAAQRGAAPPVPMSFRAALRYTGQNGQPNNAGYGG